MTTAAYRRQATAMERLFTRSPFSVVTMVAWVKGDVTEEALAGAVAKIQQRHTATRRRSRWSSPVPCTAPMA